MIKKRRILAGLSCVLLLCALLPVMVLARQHNDKPDSGLPNDLVASYDFEIDKCTDGKEAWVLESIRVYKLYWTNSKDEEWAYWEIKNVHFDEKENSLNLNVLFDAKGDSLFSMFFVSGGNCGERIFLPDSPVKDAKEFTILTVNEDWERGTKDDNTGWISVLSTRNGVDLSDDEYVVEIGYGTKTTVDGMSARRHDLARLVPKAEPGATFVVSAFNAYFAVDFKYTVPNPTGGIVQNVATVAEETPGEDEGVDINPEIIEPTKQKAQKKDSDTATSAVMGVIGALAAAGALGVAAATAAALGVAGTLAVKGAMGASEGADKQDGGTEEKRKRYRIYTYKAFGDAIQKGAQPVKVCARISKIIDGKESDCPEQTEKLEVSGDNLTVRPVGVEGAYMAAEVSADSASTAENGSITFTLAGSGGMIRRTVTFRLVNEPQIAFPGETGDGHWDLNVRLDTVKMVAGEGGKERLRFVILDAMEEPKEIQFRDTKGFTIDYEKDPKLGFTYYALIDNETDPIEKGGGIFADKEDQRITVEAIFKDGLRISNYFTIELYPDGLSVIPLKDYVKDNHLIIDTVENPKAGAGHSKIQPVIFDFMVCYVDDRTQKAVIKKNPSCDHEDPTDNGRYGLLFSDNFEYHIKHMGAAGVGFFPDNTLPELGDPYEATMLISHDTERQHFEGEIPLAVYGERPKPPGSAEWQEAYKWLQRDIKYFGIGNDPQIKTMLKEIAEDNTRHSAAQIADTRKAIICAGVFFYQKYGDACRDFEKLTTRYLVVAVSLVSAGDMAVEFILRKYFVGYGAIIANFSNPLKNLLCTYVGEFIANGNLDQAPDFIETVLDSCENALSAAITGLICGDLDDPLDVTFDFAGKKLLQIAKPPVSEQIKKVLGYVIATYLLIRFARHYNDGEDGEKGDVFRSVIASFKDLGLAVFKAWFLNFVSSHCVSLFRKIGELCGKLFKKACEKQLKELAAKAGQKAYNDSVRKAFQSSPDELSRAAYNTAKELQKKAIRNVEGPVKNHLDAGIEAMGDAGNMIGRGVKNIIDGGDGGLGGQFLNYILGGKEDGTESIGSDPKDILFELVYEWLGVKANKIYECVVPENIREQLTQVDMSIEGGNIVLTLLGYRVEIDIKENLTALIELMFETMFPWMGPLFEAVKNSTGWNDIPDCRDRTEKNVEKIGQELEETKQRIENNQWRFTG